MTTTAARRDWAAVVSLGLGVFTITTTEIMPIGLLRPMANDLDVSEGTIGLTVTFFAFVAAVSAPTLSTATRRLDRRPILLCVMAAFVVGNTLTALAVNYAMLVAVRMAIGVALGLMWAIVAATAVRLVPPNAAVRATTIAFSGVSLASVLGMPVGTVIGQAFGWRAAYWTLAGLSLVSLVALTVLLRSVPGDSETIGLRGLPRLLRMRDLRTTLIVTALVITGAYAAYTYVTPFIVEILGIDADLVGIVLLVMGVAGVAGNFTAGAFLTRTQSVRWSLAAIIAVLAGALVLARRESVASRGSRRTPRVGRRIRRCPDRPADDGVPRGTRLPGVGDDALLHDVQLLDRRRRTDRRPGDRARWRARTRRRRSRVRRHRPRRRAHAPPSHHSRRRRRSRSVRVVPALG